MTYVLYVTAIIAGFVFKKSKLCTGYMYLVMLVLAGFRTQSADFKPYMMEYAQAGAEATQYTRYIGYFLFQKIFRVLGLEFEEYLVVVYLIGFLLLIISIRMSTTKVNAVLALYLIYSFAMDVIQIKSFLANMFALLGIILLLKEHKNDVKKSKYAKFMKIICSMLLLIVGGLFHFSVMLYVACAVVYLLTGYKKNVMKKIYTICVFLVLFIYSGGLSFILSIANSIGILGDMKYLQSWTSIETRLGWIIPAVWVLLVCFVCKYVMRKNLLNEDDLLYAIIKFSMTAILLIPFFLLDVTMSRLVRIFMILLYIIFVNAKKTSRVTLKQGGSYLAFLICIIYAVCFEIVPVYDETLGALLEHNSLFR